MGQGPKVLGALGPRPLGPWDLRYLGPKVRGPEVRGPKAQGLMTLEPGGVGGRQPLGKNSHFIHFFLKGLRPLFKSSTKVLSAQGVHSLGKPKHDPGSIPRRDIGPRLVGKGEAL